MTNAIQIAAWLYDARDCLKYLLGSRYEENIKPYKEELQKLASVKNCKPMEAALHMMKDVEVVVTDLPDQALIKNYIAAATVELYENK